LFEYDLYENSNPRVTAFWNDLLDGSPQNLEEPSTPDDMNLKEEYNSIPKKCINNGNLHSKRNMLANKNNSKSIVEHL
jgi:hypothetical protein